MGGREEGNQIGKKKERKGRADEPSPRKYLKTTID